MKAHKTVYGWTTKLLQGTAGAPCDCAWGARLGTQDSRTSTPQRCISWDQYICCRTKHSRNGSSDRYPSSTDGVLQLAVVLPRLLPALQKCRLDLYSPADCATVCIYADASLLGQSASVLKSRRHSSSSSTILRVTTWGVGGSDRIKSLWPTWAVGATCVVFAVDASGGNERCKLAGSELEDLGEMEWTLDLPLIVVGTKMDAPGALTADEVADACSAASWSRRDRGWSCISYSAEAEGGAGLVRKAATE